MKNIVILGSTGSIGRQTLDIIQRLPERFRVLGLAAHASVSLLVDQANAVGARRVCIGNGAGLVDRVRAGLAAKDVEVLCGVEGMCEMVTDPSVDIVVVAVAGAIGIKPTHAAIEAGKTIALASKEVLVAAGEHTMRLAREKGVPILPIDSEHSALFQCLQGAPEKSVETLLLTASGGPFRKMPADELASVTPEQALKHPTWTMGGLVTINSATLMNKGLEVIEAHWLFDVPISQVQVVVHPQSIIHSMVRFNDGSILAQMGLPDMRLPIQYALVYPDRLDTELPRLNPAHCGPLTFEEPDHARFPAIGIAMHAVETGGTLPAVMNAANEAAVGLFLEHRIPYNGIMKTIETVMGRHHPVDPTYENVLAADAWARSEALSANGVRANA